MRAVVIGLGSMGKRRIRLIRQFDESIEIIGVDTQPQRRNDCTAEYGIKTNESIDEAYRVSSPDCAFVCTSPLSHSGIITKCLSLGMHVFTELNLVSDGYQKNIELSKEMGKTLFLSSTFLYREETAQIRRIAEQVGCLLNYVYHIGQYLPDWHPWESYESFFVNDKRSNGCREIFAIELPWLTGAFGKITSAQAVKGSISTLKIDYPDNYLVIVQHESGHKGMLAVDVVSRKAVRNLEVFGEKLHLQWNGTPQGLKVYDYDRKAEETIEIYKEGTIDQLENYSRFIVENGYRNEIECFFNAVAHKQAPLYTFEEDERILKIIDEIEA